MQHSFRAAAASTVRVVAIAGALVLCGNLLGLLLRTARDRQMPEWPLVPFGVLGTIEASRRSAQHKRRRTEPSQKSPASTLRRITTIVAVVAAVLLVLVLPALMAGFTKWLRSPSFGAINLSLSVAIVAVPLLSILRASVLRKLTWKKLADPWLKWSGVSGIAVGGFGFIGLGTDEQRTALLKLALTRSQLPVAQLATVYMCAVILVGLAYLLQLVGSSAADSEESFRPIVYFAPAFTLAWVGNLLFYALFLDGALLTLSAHLAGSGGRS